jgi:hypothetical protein
VVDRDNTCYHEAMKARTTTLYLRNVPAAAARAAKAEAARRGEPLGRVFADALAHHLGAAAPTATDTDLASDREWLAANRARLAHRYAGEYIAIVDRAVVDHDREFEPLASRVFARYGVRSVLMPRVEREPAPARTRSPRARRR